MTRDEIVGEVIKLLRGHKEGWRGSIHQDPYKSDFFALFAKAHNARMMHGGLDNVLYADALAHCINEQAPELLDGPPWPDLYTMWGEWTYAWKHISAWRNPSDPIQVMRAIGVSGPFGEA